MKLLVPLVICSISVFAGTPVDLDGVEEIVGKVPSIELRCTDKTPTKLKVKVRLTDVRVARQLRCSGGWNVYRAREWSPAGYCPEVNEGTLMRSCNLWAVTESGTQTKSIVFKLNNGCKAGDTFVVYAFPEFNIPCPHVYDPMSGYSNDFQDARSFINSSVYADINNYDVSQPISFALEHYKIKYLR